MLIECLGSNSAHDEEKLNTFLQNIMEGGNGGQKAIADGGTVATDTSQMLVKLCPTDLEGNNVMNIK